MSNTDSTLPIRPRKWYFAALLTFIHPGLGHMYAGRFQRGLLVVGANLALILAMLLLNLPATPTGLLVFLAIGAAAFAAMLFDAAKLCRSGVFEPKFYNSWKYYILAILGGIAMHAILGATDYFWTRQVKSYRISAMSMANTLLPDDHIYADMGYYKSRAPKPGDLAVMKFPKDHTLAYVKRIVAGPGDRVSFSGRRVAVNGKCIDASRHAPPDAKANALADSPKGEAVLGRDEFFVLGDNVDHSQDSRCFGPVRRGEILGRPLYIYLSPDFERIGRALN